MRWYIDTSVAAWAILPAEDRRAAHWFRERLADGDQMVASTLLELEAIRLLRRERLDLDLAVPFLACISLVSINDGILRAAAAIEPHVRSLDAIHLATCALFSPAITLVSHDVGMLTAAAAMSIDTFDPLAEPYRS